MYPELFILKFLLYASEIIKYTIVRLIVIEFAKRSRFENQNPGLRNRNYARGSHYLLTRCLNIKFEV